MTRREASPDPHVEVVTDGEVADGARRAAGAMIRSLGDLTSRPIVFARVKLHSAAVEDSDQRARAQGMIDVSGTVIRAEGEAPTADQALAAVGERLERRLRHVQERRQDHRRPRSGRGEWRSGDLPAERPDFYPRPREDRRIERRKTWGPAEMTIEEALFDLEVLDHRFYLFTDAADGEDAIVYETEGGLAVRRAPGGEPDGRAEALEVVVNPAPAPELGAGEAVQQLDDSGEPFIFHRDPETGRAGVMYRRYDGHYGLIVPAD
jgi:ribosome-associated translation inhibitor RaiA